MRWRRRLAVNGLAVLMVGLAAVLPQASPASAVVPHATFLDCATGAITSATVAGKVATLKGWIQPCAGKKQPATGSAFAIGWYVWHDTQFVGLRHTTLQYALGATPQRTNFSVPVDFTGSTPALCLAYAPGARLGCVNISWVNGVAQSNPLSVNDPKVSVPVNPFVIDRGAEMWDIRGVPCATAAISSVVIDQGSAKVSGSIKPCSTDRAPREFDYFTIAKYEWGGDSFVGTAGYPRSFDAPGTWGTTFFTVTETIGSSTPALCVTTSADTRLACVNIAWVSGAQEASALSVTAPKVSVTLADPILVSPDPRCGTCW